MHIVVAAKYLGRLLQIEADAPVSQLPTLGLSFSPSPAFAGDEVTGTISVDGAAPSDLTDVTVTVDGQPVAVDGMSFAFTAA